MNIRKAEERDLSRIAEIEIFNYRLFFYPIFQNDRFYFEELQVIAVLDEIRKKKESLFVYDDGTVKAFMQIKGKELKKLFVEPVLQGKAIGSAMISYAISEMGIRYLWALEKNGRAIKFYKTHGFEISGEKKLEEGTTEYLIKLVLGQDACSFPD